MLDLINALLGFNLIDTFGDYFACMVVVLFAVISVDFFIQLFLVFWRWLFHDR